MRIMKAGSLLLAAAALSVWPTNARAWHGGGHDKATTVAVSVVAKKLPKFFSSGAATIAHCSQDPDTFRHPIAPDSLHKAESPEHFFDLELLEGNKLPADRQAFAALCRAENLDVAKIGLLPYAVTDWTERLSIALAEHRKWPDNPHIQSKCLVYAGILSHCAQDLTMPLHTTIHYDGRARSDGSSPRTGIHAKVDALLGKCSAPLAEVVKGLPVKVFVRLLPEVMGELRRSHAMVDKVYHLSEKLPAIDESISVGSNVASFTLERLRTAASFTASLYVTAWQRSKAIELPAWHRRKTSKPASSGTTLSQCSQTLPRRTANCKIKIAEYRLALPEFRHQSYRHVLRWPAG